MNRIKLTTDQIDELAEELRGTVSSINYTLEDLFNIDSFFDLDDDTLRQIDEIVFECEHCGWWYSTDEEDEYDGYAMCSSCAEDHESREEDDEDE